MKYPKEIFCVREDITAENMRRYDEWDEKVYQKMVELNPNLHSLSLREYHALRKQAEAIVGNW